eukprot:scaffold4995_cov117-Isochrysis_galbana.AAC.2
MEPKSSARPSASLALDAIKSFVLANSSFVLDISIQIQTDRQKSDREVRHETQAPYTLHPPSQSVTRTPDSRTPALPPHIPLITHSLTHSHSPLTHPHTLILTPIKLPPI